MTPRVFISYSWSSPTYRSLILEWAERLQHDGVEVVLDVWDLEAGADMNAYMERMVNDSSVTHVLVFSDRLYTRKANARRPGGVGTESLIISAEVYGSAKQTKFIPIITESADDGTPCLPTFMKARLAVDFSTPALAERNWEQLLRILFGKPARPRPALGQPPAYIRDDSMPASPVSAKLATLRRAVERNDRLQSSARRAFMAACQSRVRDWRGHTAQPEASNMTVVDIAQGLSDLRNDIVAWVMVEGDPGVSTSFAADLHSLLEALLAEQHGLPRSPAANAAWREGLAIFLNDLFLHVVATLVKLHRDDVVYLVFREGYFLPDDAEATGGRFVTFDRFVTHSALLERELTPEGKRIFSPVGEYIKGHATSEHIELRELIEAELLAILCALAHEDARWYPQLLFYAGYTRTPEFFARAASARGYRRIATMTGFDDPSRLREAVEAGMKRVGVDRWSDLFYADKSLPRALGLNAWATVE